MAAQKAVENKMKECMQSANNITSSSDRQTAITSCRTESAAQALKGNLGENVSAVEVQKFLENAATNSVQKAIQNAMMVQELKREKSGSARRQPLLHKPLKSKCDDAKSRNTSMKAQRMLYGTNER